MSEIMRRMNTLSSTTSTVAGAPGESDLDMAGALPRDANSAVSQVEVQGTTVIAANLFGNDWYSVDRQGSSRSLDVLLPDVSLAGGHQVLKHAGAANQACGDASAIGARRLQFRQ
jgi:hypothetical protein